MAKHNRSGLSRCPAWIEQTPYSLFHRAGMPSFAEKLCNHTWTWPTHETFTSIKHFRLHADKGTLCYTGAVQSSRGTASLQGQHHHAPTKGMESHFHARGGLIAGSEQQTSFTQILKCCILQVQDFQQLAQSSFPYQECREEGGFSG